MRLSKGALRVQLRFDGLTTPRKIEGRLTRSPAMTLRPIDRLRVVRKIEPPCSGSW